MQSPLRQRLIKLKQLIPLKSFIYDSLLIKGIQNLRYVQELFKAKTICFSLKTVTGIQRTMDIAKYNLQDVLKGVLSQS